MIRCGLRLILKDVPWLTNRKVQSLPYHINSIAFIQSVGTYSLAASLSDNALPDSVPKQNSMSEKVNPKMD